MYKFFLRSHQYISEASCGLIKTQTWERCLGIVVTPVLSNSLILSRQPAMPTRVALLLCKLSSGCSREGSWHLKRTRRAYVSVARHRAAGVCRVVSVRKDHWLLQLPSLGDTCVFRDWDPLCRLEL